MTIHQKMLMKNHKIPKEPRFFAFGGHRNTTWYFTKGLGYYTKGCLVVRVVAKSEGSKK